MLNAFFVDITSCEKTLAVGKMEQRRKLCIYARNFLPLVIALSTEALNKELEAKHSLIS
jgi:hypothetical protein